MALFGTVSMLHPMQPELSEPVTEIPFKDHILLPDGHMRAIYDPICKTMWLMTFGIEGNIRTSYKQRPFRFLNPKTKAVEPVEINHISGIAEYKHYIFYAAVASLRDEKNVQIVGRQDMIDNATTYQWTSNPDPIYSNISIESLLVSKEHIFTKTTAFNKKKGQVDNNVTTKLIKENLIRE